MKFQLTKNLTIRKWLIISIFTTLTILQMIVTYKARIADSSHWGAIITAVIIVSVAIFMGFSVKKPVYYRSTGSMVAIYFIWILTESIKTMFIFHGYRMLLLPGASVINPLIWTMITVSIATGSMYWIRTTPPTQDSLKQQTVFNLSVFGAGVLLVANAYTIWLGIPYGVHYLIALAIAIAICAFTGVFPRIFFSMESLNIKNIAILSGFVATILYGLRQTSRGIAVIITPIITDEFWHFVLALMLTSFILLLLSYEAIAQKSE